MKQDVSKSRNWLRRQARRLKRRSVVELYSTLRRKGNRRRIAVGIVVTVGYLLFVCIYAICILPRILGEPSGFGDFLAGVFSPLAFLWLVLGYFQQGDELKQNTAALRLQAEELHRSVHQQAAMLEEVKRAQARRDIAARPRLRWMEPRAALDIEGDNYFGVTVENCGMPIFIEWARIRYDQPNNEPQTARAFQNTLVTTGEKVEVYAFLSSRLPYGPFLLEIRYLDSEANSGTLKVCGYAEPVEPEHPHSPLDLSMDNLSSEIAPDQ